jgi:Protein of unknown function (DUF1566)
MTESPAKLAFAFRSSEARLIRAMVGDDKGLSFSATTFPETQLERVMELGTDRSAIVLLSGIKIPVAVSYEDLEQKIYTPSFRTVGPVLDLRDVTGEVAKPKIPANTNQVPAPGDTMPDRTIFAGISPDTDKPMYATPADAPLTMKFNEAKGYAAKLEAHGHKDWRVPTKAELNVLFNNRAAIGGFNVSGSYPAGWYWSSSNYNELFAWGQSFSDGRQDYYPKDIRSSVRLVR